MKFSPSTIELARELKRLGVPWEPRAGHYVLDETGFCPKPSPFQEGVYFILNYDYFMKKVGGVPRFKEIMTWLPTWHDCRERLTELGVSEDRLTKALAAAETWQSHAELDRLYELLLEELVSSHSIR